MTGDLVIAAVRYAKAGWPVFPLQEGSKLPKIPKIEGGRGFHDASTDVRQIGRWWATWPEANIGVRTGSIGGFFVLDVDVDAGGPESLVALQDEHGPLPVTAKAETATGGHHHFFRYADGLRNSASKIGVGLDIRADGGYCVGAPSRRNGRSYTWVVEAALAEAPQWLIDAASKTEPGAPSAPFAATTVRSCGQSSPYGLAALARAEGDVRSAAPGTRNHTLNACAYSIGRLVGGAEVDAETAAEALVDAATSAGLPAFEALNTVKSGLTSGMLLPKQAPEAADLASLMKQATRR